MSSLTTLSQLVDAGLVLADQAPSLAPVADEFRIQITDAMRGAINTPEDGVGRQFVPTMDELTIRPEELADPIGDRVHEPVEGLTHRYPDRAILHVTQTCAVYCRFCFRRETVGDSGTLTEAQLEGVYAYLARTPAIREVILTGGDPLVLSPRRLGAILLRLQALGLDTLRIHSRIPVVQPERITPELLEALDLDIPVWLVVHTNHAQEMTPEASAALRRLSKAGVPLLSQSVLLRGVNDSVEALETLFRTLVKNRVKPYYLHHCDLAKGAGHFRTSIAEGQALMAALRGKISGTMLPTYILDIPGGFGKIPLTPVSAYQDPTHPKADWCVIDPNGRKHRYSDPA